MDILFTNRKLPSIYSESVPKNKVKSQHIQLRLKYKKYLCLSVSHDDDLCDNDDDDDDDDDD